MLRSAMAALALLSAIHAQNPPPIEVIGRIAPLDPETSKRSGRDGPGVYTTVKNTSGRDVQAFAFSVVFTDPQSGKPVEGQRERSEYQPPSDGVLLAANASEHERKPFPIPPTASGALASYSFDIDLVVFEDGTTWGPAKTRTAKELLEQIRKH